MLITFIQNSIPDKLEATMELQPRLIKKLMDSNRILGDHSVLKFSNFKVDDDSYLVTDYVVNNNDDSHVIISNHPLIINAFPKIRLLPGYFGTSPRFSDSAVQVIFDIFNKRYEPRDDMCMLVVDGELCDGFEACMVTKEFRCVAYQS